MLVEVCGTIQDGVLAYKSLTFRCLKLGDNFWKEVLDFLKGEDEENRNVEHKISTINRFKLQVISHLPPKHVQVELTTKCNLKCKFCIRSNEIDGDMSMELFKSIIDQLRRYKPLTRTLDFTGVGEPLLCEHLIPSIKYAKRYGFTVSFISSFTFMNQALASDLVKAQLDNLYVSFDGVSKQTFEKIRIGASFEQVLENIKLFISVKNRLKSFKPRLVLRPTIYPDNVHEIPQFFELAEKLKVDGVSFGDYVVRGESAGLPINNKPKRRKKISLFNFGRNFPPCISYCYISFDGKVLPCGYLTQMVPRKDYPLFQLGDLNQNSFSEIWFGQRYKHFKSKIMSSNPHPKCTTVSKCYQ